MLFHCHIHLHWTITNPWSCTGIVPSACHCIRHEALLSSLSNETAHLYHCQIPTRFTTHEVFGTESHSFELQSGRGKAEGIIFAMVRRIFEFLNIKKIPQFLIIMCIKNTTVLFCDWIIHLTIAQIMFSTFTLPVYSSNGWDLVP